MYFSNMKYVISSVAVVTTILQFLSGVLVCKQYVVNGTTGEATPLPFISGVITAALWLLYGLTKNDNKIVFVNAIGLLLMTIYTIMFYLYAFKKSTILKQIFMMLTFLLIIFIYVENEQDKQVLLTNLGLLTCSVTMLNVAAPMSKLLYVIKAKNTDCLPFPMILMSFFVSALWFLYGLLEDDTFIIVPNFVGGALALSQLSLFVIYPSVPQSPLFTKSIQA